MPGNGNSSPTSNSGSTGPMANLVSNFTLDQILDISGAHIVNQQGTAADGSEVTHTTFSTSMTSTLNVNITEDLSGIVQSFYDDESDPTSPASLIMSQIKNYASKIKCESFQGKGTVDDYAQLFQAASTIDD